LALLGFLIGNRDLIFDSRHLVNQWWRLVCHSKAPFVRAIKIYMARFSVRAPLCWFPKLIDFLEENYQSAIARTFFNFWYHQSQV
jgi:hypothetical protein